jgi:ABC-2 type transport system ATP-binding protein
LLRAEHLTKYYGTTCAVNDVSFTVRRGEVAALLGPNGSGKSTLMRMLTGFFSPTAGRVLIDDVDVATRPAAARRRLGYLPEQVALYPELTVRRYLAFVAEVKGLAASARRVAVREVVDRCGLADVADRLAGTLSKGYRQRVGLAQALLGDPDVLVLDEPTVGLDPVQTVDMRALLRTLAGRTVLLSTHILSEASALCSASSSWPAGVSSPRTRRTASRAGSGSRASRSGSTARRRAWPRCSPGCPASCASRRRHRRPAGSRVRGLRERARARATALAAAVVGAAALLAVTLSVPTLEDLFVQLVGPRGSPRRRSRAEGGGCAASSRCFARSSARTSGRRSSIWSPRPSSRSPATTSTATSSTSSRSGSA